MSAWYLMPAQSDNSLVLSIIQDICLTNVSLIPKADTGVCLMSKKISSESDICQMQTFVCLMSEAGTHICLTQASFIRDRHLFDSDTDICLSDAWSACFTYLSIYCFRQQETFAYARHKLIIVSLICIPCKYIREYIVVSFSGGIGQSVVSCPSLRL